MSRPLLRSCGRILFCACNGSCLMRQHVAFRVHRNCTRRARQHLESMQPNSNSPAKKLPISPQLASALSGLISGVSIGWPGLERLCETAELPLQSLQSSPGHPTAERLYLTVTERRHSCRQWLPHSGINRTTAELCGQRDRYGGKCRNGRRRAIEISLRASHFVLCPMDDQQKLADL